jgi:hypothetical protein
MDGSLWLEKLFHSCNAKNRLESFWSLGPKNWPTQTMNSLVDSGGFVARTKGVKILVQEYSRYLRKYKVPKAFELDTNDMQETAYNRDYLIKNTETLIIPIYHYSTFKSGNEKFLFDLMDKHNYIGLGGVVGGAVKSTRREKDEFFDFVFRNTRDKWKIHGLGITDPYSMKRYPFFSVDSSQWLDSWKFAKFEGIKTGTEYHEFMKKNKPIEFKLKREISHRVFLEHYITKLWEIKGVTWNTL